MCMCAPSSSMGPLFGHPGTFVCHLIGSTPFSNPYLYSSAGIFALCWVLIAAYTTCFYLSCQTKCLSKLRLRKCYSDTTHVSIRPLQPQTLPNHTRRSMLWHSGSSSNLPSCPTYCVMGMLWSPRFLLSKPCTIVRYQLFTLSF